MLLLSADRLGELGIYTVQQIGDMLPYVHMYNTTTKL